MNENRSPEAAEAQAELTAEREHVAAMRHATEVQALAQAKANQHHADSIPGTSLSDEALTKAKAGLLNAVSLAVVLGSGLGAWYVIADVL